MYVKLYPSAISRTKRGLGDGFAARAYGELCTGAFRISYLPYCLAYEAAHALTPPPGSNGADVIDNATSNLPFGIRTTGTPQEPNAGALTSHQLAVQANQEAQDLVKASGGKLSFAEALAQASKDVNAAAPPQSGWNKGLIAALVAAGGVGLAVALR